MTKFVAEIGSNWVTDDVTSKDDMSRLGALIDAASEAGFWGIKFQLFAGKRLYADKAKAASMKPFELPESWIPAIRMMAHASNLKFGLSVFDVDAVARVAPYCDFLKISSYSLLDTRLIAAAVETKLPVVIGTGMASHDEVLELVGLFKQPTDLTLLHCVSEYPAPLDDLNLRALRTMQDLVPWAHIGWSDHTCNPGVVLSAALRYGVAMIEMHFDLDDKAGHETAHSWTKSSSAAVIAAVRDAGVADGGVEKGPTVGELFERNWRADPTDGLRPMKAFRSVK